MAHSVRRHLDVHIDAYDRAIRRFIPGYEEMLSVAAEAVASAAPSHVVDLGAGTGALAASVLERPAVGTVELLDIDPEMMEQARIRLGGFGDRARFTSGSYFDPLPRCGAVCASLSLHHIPSLSRKAVLYESIYAALEKGGCLRERRRHDAPGRAGSGRGVRILGSPQRDPRDLGRAGTGQLRGLGRGGHVLSRRGGARGVGGSRLRSGVRLAECTDQRLGGEEGAVVVDPDLPYSRNIRVRVRSNASAKARLSASE